MGNNINKKNSKTPLLEHNNNNNNNNNNFGTLKEYNWLVPEKIRQPKVSSVAIKDIHTGIMEYNEKLIKITQGHPNIHPIEVTYWKPDFNEYWCIMRRLDGYDLVDYIDYLHEYQLEEQILYITKEILKGLSYLHKNDVIHKDIKTENIRIVDSKNGKIDAYNILDIGSFSVIIYDFGLSEFASENITRRSGTSGFIAPEILDISTKYDARVDIWSLGIMLFQLMTLKTPNELLGPESAMPNKKGKRNENENLT